MRQDNLHYRHSNNSGGRFVDQIGIFGLGDVCLDEYALTWTRLGGMNHINRVTRCDLSKAP